MKHFQKLAVERMTVVRDERKRWYDGNAVERTFKVGDKVLILALAKTNKFYVNWIGLGIIEIQLSETNYIVKIPEKREQSQKYHVNI